MRSLSIALAKRCRHVCASRECLRAHAVLSSSWMGPKGHAQISLNKAQNPELHFRIPELHLRNPELHCWIFAPGCPKSRVASPENSGFCDTLAFRTTRGPGPEQNPTTGKAQPDQKKPPARTRPLQMVIFCGSVLPVRPPVFVFFCPQ